MSKLHLKVAIDICVDTEITDVNEIMDKINVEIYPDDMSEILVEDYSVIDTELTDAR